MRSVADPVRYDAYDAVVIVTDHTGIDYGRMVREAPLVVDTRNALKSVRNRSSVASLSWSEKLTGSGLPMAASISATTSGRINGGGIAGP
jgi:hypothetical protein